jgi:hypothetical protein
VHRHAHKPALSQKIRARERKQTRALACVAYGEVMSSTGIPSSGRRRPDGIPLPTVPGLVAWHQRLRRMVADSPYSASQYGPAHGIAQRFVQDHTNPTNEYKVPGLEGIYAIDRGTDYKIIDQVKDLFDLSPGELDSRLPLWEPRQSAERLLDGLRTVLGWSHATAPSVFELAETLHTSCLNSGDVGRWRVRIFDIEYGRHFPFLSTRAVEFLRWYGSGVGVEDDPDRNRAYAYIHEATNGFTNSETVKVEWWLNDDIVPGTFQPDLPEQDRRDRWDSVRYERAELILRMGSTYAAARGEWTGGYGLIHQSLLRHHDNATGRHMYLTPVTGMTPAATPQRLADDFAGVESVLLLGVGGVAYRRLEFLIGDALGWTSMSGGDLAQRLTGRRFHFQAMRRPEIFAQVFTEFGDRPRPTSVLSVHLDHLVSEIDGRQRLLPAAIRLLHNPKVLPVLITPRDGSASLDLWEERQEAQSRSGQSSMLVNQALHSQRLYRLVTDELDKTPGAVTAVLQPSLPWAGPAVHRLAPDYDLDVVPSTAPEWFLHPLLGDIMVRASYEIARYLRLGSMKDPGQPTTFSAGSTVSQFEPSLRACTQGRFWTDERLVEAFDESLVTPPHRHGDRTRPRTARTVALTHTGRRT